MTKREPDATGALPAPDDVGRDGSDLELLAIEEHFVEALRAGASPRLSDYLRRYPTYAEQLTDFASALLAEAVREPDEMGDAEPEAAGPGLSPGTRRALAAIRVEVGAQRFAEKVVRGARVAEERATYVAQPEESEQRREEMEKEEES